MVPVKVFNPLINGDEIICTSDKANYFILVLILYKLLLAFFASVIAVLTKDVDKKFRESKQMAWTLYTISLVNLILLPLMFSLNLIPEVRFVLVVVDILWVVFFSTTFLFAGRLYKAFTQKITDLNNNNGAKITRIVTQTETVQ